MFISGAGSGREFPTLVHSGAQPGGYERRNGYQLYEGPCITGGL